MGLKGSVEIFLVSSKAGDKPVADGDDGCCSFELVASNFQRFYEFMDEIGVCVNVGGGFGRLGF